MNGGLLLSIISFDENFLKKLDRLALATKMVVKGETGGNRKSSHKGSSVEFSDFREYVHGDDFRRIDWNAYARFERFFIKLFMEEQESLVTIFIDCSKSMDWGQPHKGTLAKQLSAVFAYLALANYDRVALVALSERPEFQLAPFSGKQGFWKALEFIDKIPYDGKTRLNAAIRNYSNLGGRGGISIILTDLFSFDGYEETLKYLQYKKQEITLVHILSPQELEPKWSGSFRLIDSEGGEPKEITITPQILRSYKKVLKSFLQEVQGFCYQRGINYIPVSSALSLEQVVFDKLVRLGVIGR